MRFPWRRFGREMCAAESAINLHQLVVHSAPVHRFRGLDWMRLRPLFFACLIACAAWTAQAQSDADEAQSRFLAELDRQCPAKQLQMLAPSQLRDGLDAYMDALPSDTRAMLQKSETDHCSSLEAGAACVNMADILAADQLGRMPDLVSSLCVTFLRCRDQGDCDYAR